MEGATGGEILIKHGGAGAGLEGADGGNDPWTKASMVYKQPQSYPQLAGTPPAL